jgi:hypothetical protein
MWTNWLRFGAPLEFGHRLNFSGFDMTYISRFGAPFDNESLWSRVKDVIGATFFVNRLNGYQDCYADGLCAWQAAVPRWRAFYSTTFDITELVVLVAFWAWAMSRLISHWRKRDLISPWIAPAIWSFVSFLPLVGFYARYCAISSRYILDFAPAIAAVVVGALCAISETLKERKAGTMLRWGAATVALIWWAAEIALARNIMQPTIDWSQADVLAEMEGSKAGPPVIPDHYDPSSAAANDRLIFNGRGWRASDGATNSLVTLFIEDPELLQLQLRTSDRGQVTESDYAAVEARIGLETLKLESAIDIDGGRVLTFAGPEQKRYQKGVQVAFIKFLPPGKFQESNVSPFKLLRVDWKTQQ